MPGHRSYYPLQESAYESHNWWAIIRHMEFDLTTFFLEIVNLLILVWVLKRLLFKPIQDVIEKRQNAIQKEIENANLIRQDAEKLKSQFETRIHDWNAEKSKRVSQLVGEVEQLRKKELEALERELENERIKSESLLEKGLQDERKKLVRESYSAASRFSSRFISRLASPELDLALAKIAIEDLNKAAEETIENIRESSNNSPIKVLSAHKLLSQARTEITITLNSIFGNNVQIDFSEDESLRCGVRFEVGSYWIKANIRDELESFFHNVE